MPLRNVPQDEDDFSQNLGLDAIRALIGDDDTMRLLEECGGTRIYIPARVKAEEAETPSKILQYVSRKNAIRLSEEFGGLFYDVPVARKFRIARYRARGCTLNDIAQKVGISRCAVTRSLKKMRMENLNSFQKGA